jgi:hypothetical protein
LDLYLDHGSLVRKVSELKGIPRKVLTELIKKAMAYIKTNYKPEDIYDGR